MFKDTIRVKKNFLIFINRILLINVFYLTSNNCTYAQIDKNKLRENKQKIEQEIQYTNKLLNETKKDKQASLNQLIILKKQISQREQLINNINQEISNLSDEIGKTEHSVEQLNMELNSLKTEYARMIVSANKNRGNYNLVMFIFAAENFNQAFQRLKYYQKYSEYRKKQVKLINETQAKLIQKKQQLEDHLNNKNKLLTSNQTEKNQLTKEQEEKNKTVKQLQKTEKELLNTLRKKEQEARNLQKAIEKVIAEEVKKAKEADRIRREKLGKNDEMTNVKTNKRIPSDIMSATPEEMELSHNFASNKGRLPWPTEKGLISSTFGTHAHPELPGIVINNDGIDITTNRGANARSIFNGEVTAVISGPNGKQVVIIRHGNYLSVYSNLEKVFVKRGDKVSTKQKIGLISTDNEDNQTVIQFQIWDGNNKVNPEYWIAR